MWSCGISADHVALQLHSKQTLTKGFNDGEKDDANYGTIQASKPTLKSAH